ncbi:hypothetical protein, partial [Streptomyces acidiscabies]
MIETLSRHVAPSDSAGPARGPAESDRRAGHRPGGTPEEGRASRAAPPARARSVLARRRDHALHLGVDGEQLPHRRLR